MLLGAGANTSIVNKIGKTAAQLGSFVGQHDCVQVINNYFTLSDLLEYTSRPKTDGQPRLASSVAQFLHKLLISTRVHPVHVSDSATDVLITSLHPLHTPTPHTHTSWFSVYGLSLHFLKQREMFVMSLRKCLPI